MLRRLSKSLRGRKSSTSKSKSKSKSRPTVTDIQEALHSKSGARKTIGGKDAKSKKEGLESIRDLVKLKKEGHTSIDRTESQTRIREKWTEGEIKPEIELSTMTPRGIDPDDMEGLIRQYKLDVTPKEAEHKRLPPFLPGMTTSDEDNLKLLPKASEIEARHHLTKRKTKKQIEQENRIRDEAWQSKLKEIAEAKLAEKKKEDAKKARVTQHIHKHLGHGHGHGHGGSAPPPPRKSTHATPVPAPQKVDVAQKPEHKPPIPKKSTPAPSKPSSTQMPKKNMPTPDKPEVPLKPALKPPPPKESSVKTMLKPKDLKKSVTMGLVETQTGPGGGDTKEVVALASVSSKTKGKKGVQKKKTKGKQPSSSSSGSSSTSSSSSEEDLWKQYMYMAGAYGGGMPMPGYGTGRGGWAPPQQYPQMYPALAANMRGFQNPGPGIPACEPPQPVPKPKVDVQGGRMKKANEGLDFEFRPHTACGMEVTITIEPDEPDPIEFALDNGINPIICCMMPPCLMVAPPGYQAGQYNQQSHSHGVQNQAQSQQQSGNNSQRTSNASNGSSGFSDTNRNGSGSGRGSKGSSGSTSWPRS